MNKFIKVIWSRTRGALVAVHEHTSACAKGASGSLLGGQKCDGISPKVTLTAVAVAVGAAFWVGPMSAWAQTSLGNATSPVCKQNDFLCLLGLPEDKVQVEPRYSLTVEAGETQTISGDELTVASGTQGSIINKGKLTLQGHGTLKFRNCIDYNAVDGGTGTISNMEAGTMIIKGGAANYGCGIEYNASGSGSRGTITNTGSGDLTIQQGTGWLTYGIYYNASDGGSGIISNTGSGELTIQGDENSGILYNAYGSESNGTIINSGIGTLTIQGESAGYGIKYNADNSGIGLIANTGSGTLAIKQEGIDSLASENGIGTISNDSEGTLKILGGKYVGIGCIAESGGIGKVANTGSGALIIQGGSQASATVGSAISTIATDGGTGTISNEDDGTLIIKGGDAGYSANGINFISSSSGSGTITNMGAGTLTIQGGTGPSKYGIEYSSRDSGSKSVISNTGSGTLTIQPGSGKKSYGIYYNAEGGGNSLISNTGTGTLTIQGGTDPENYGIYYFSEGDGSVARILNGASGTLNIFGDKTAGSYAILALAFNGATGSIENYGKMYLNANAIYNIRWTTEANGTIVNHSTGQVFTEAATIFGGSYSEPEKSLKEISIAKDGTLSSVTTSSFSAFTQKGSVWLYSTWKAYSTWEAGGTITFTDIANGTDLADSIRSEFEAAFGTGTTIKFTGTGGSSGSSGSDVFTSAVVDALVSEGKFADGSVVTSEALTLNGEAIAFKNKGAGWRGWNSLGFKGIRGAKSISVSDGRTLTLMGDQASMSMAVRATEGKATSVITDAPMTLAGSNLKLGMSALSATQGTLEAVTADAGSSVTAENGIFSISALKGKGKVFVKKNDTYTSQLTLGSMETSGGVNDGVLKVTGDSSLSGQLVNSQEAEMTLSGQVTLEKGSELANLGTLTSGAVVMDAVSAVTNFGNLTLDSIIANGTIRQSADSSMEVKGLFKIRDEGQTTLNGKVTAGTLSVGATEARLLSNDAAGARLVVDGETYVDELELVSGTVDVSENAVLAGKSLKDGGIGSKVSVATGGTFAFSYDEAGLDKFLEGYKGDRDDKAILALSTDLHLKEGGMLTVGSVAKETGAVNLGSDALLLVGTTELHGNALLSGGADQALHAEEGATIAFVDDFIWGNHYLLDGFDAASLEEMSDVGIRDKDGNEMKTSINGRGLYVTIGGTDIREKDAGYRLVENFNVMLDGHQDKDSVHGDVAFLTNALLAETNVGVAASNAVEALNGEAGVLSETLRHAERVQELVTNHALSVRPESGTLWVEGIYADVDSGNLERTTGRSAYDVETTGFMFGADAALKGWNVGAAFSAQRSDLDASSSNTSSNIDAYGFSIYGAKHFEGGWSMVVDASYVSANHDMTAYMLGKTKAETDADAWSVGVRGAKHFALGAFGITPYVGLEVVKASEDAFDSTWEGKSAFCYAEADSTIWRAPVGVKASVFAPVAFGAAKGTLNWSADLSVAPQWGDKEVEHRVSGLNLGRVDGYTAVVTDDYVGKAKLGVSYQTDHGSFSLDYEAQKGDVLKLSHGLSAKAALYF